MTLRSCLALLLLAAACKPLPTTPCLDVCVDLEETGANRIDPDDPDKDCDGFPESEDCDDLNCFIYPGAPREYNDGRDNDCDGEADVFYGCGETGAAGLPLLGGLLWMMGRARRREHDQTGDSPS